VEDDDANGDKEEEEDAAKETDGIVLGGGVEEVEELGTREPLAAKEENTKTRGDHEDPDGGATVLPCVACLQNVPENEKKIKSVEYLTAMRHVHPEEGSDGKHEPHGIRLLIGSRSTEHTELPEQSGSRYQQHVGSHVCRVETKHDAEDDREKGALNQVEERSLPLVLSAVYFNAVITGKVVCEFHRHRTSQKETEEVESLSRIFILSDQKEDQRESGENDTACRPKDGREHKVCHRGTKREGWPNSRLSQQAYGGS